MKMDAETSNKIQVALDTEVAYINGETIYAENLQRWAYRRLETWPALLDVCKELLKAYRLSRPQIFGTDDIEDSARKAIAQAESEV
jgi:hypothetical protein